MRIAAGLPTRAEEQAAQAQQEGRAAGGTSWDQAAQARSYAQHYNEAMQMYPDNHNYQQSRYIANAMARDQAAAQRADAAAANNAYKLTPEQRFQMQDQIAQRQRELIQSRQAAQEAATQRAQILANSRETVANMNANSRAFHDITMEMTVARADTVREVINERTNFRPTEDNPVYKPTPEQQAALDEAARIAIGKGIIDPNQFLPRPVSPQLVPARGGL
jgi:hypothetical protein